MKTGLCLVLAITLVSSVRAFAAEAAPSTPPTSYVNFEVGGDISAGGSAYSGRDPRFQFQLEAGGKYGAFPVSVSFGQSLTIVGVKPRVHYLFAPVASLPGLRMGPGLGAVLNYAHGSGPSPLGAATMNLIEFGAQIGVYVRYNLTDHLHVQFVPAAVDINFWRKAWINATFGGGSGSSSDIGVILNILAGVGLNF